MLPVPSVYESGLPNTVEWYMDEQGTLEHLLVRGLHAGLSNTTRSMSFAPRLCACKAYDMQQAVALRPMLCSAAGCVCGAGQGAAPGWASLDDAAA